MENINTFKLDDINSSKTDSNNSKESKTSKKSSSSNSSEIHAFAEELLTIDELKANHKNDLFYDLDPNANKSKILNILENDKIDVETKIKSFNEIMYKLTFKDRELLLQKFKNLFEKDELLQKYPNVIFRQEKKLKEIFISIIKDLLKNKAEDFKELMETKYFVETQTSNIPCLEGTEEYVFSNLINDIYDTFITKSNYPTDKKVKAIDEYKYLSNILNKKTQKPIIKPINIIENNNKIIDMEIEDENIEEKKIIKKKLDHNKYYKKLHLLEPILELYISEEFQKKYNEFFTEYPELKKDKRIKYIYEIILESLFYYALSFNEIGKKKIISNYKRIFYEKEEEKLKLLNNKEFDIKVIDENGNELNVRKELKNKEYKVIVGSCQFNMNFYDYNIVDLFDALEEIQIIEDKEKKKFIEDKLNNFKYWTIQKHIRFNSLYNDENLTKSFNEEIDIMLKHKVLESVFNEINIFDNYSYPFHKKEFLNQVHKSIVYIPLPTKYILGLTIKKLGIIIINKGRYHELINEQNSKNIKYILKLSEFSFYKITLFHEINFHYFLIILFSNKKINYLDTPKIVFKNYLITEKIDFGAKGEALLFGTQVNELYIKAIINIITLQLWDECTGMKPMEIGKKFLEINAETTEEIKLERLINLSNFTKHLFDVIKKEYDIAPFNLSMDIGKYFSRGKILNIYVESEDNFFDFEEFVANPLSNTENV